MTYALLAGVFLALATVPVVAAVLTGGLPSGWWPVTGAVALVLLVLTAGFDSLMIAAHLFGYDTGSLIGLRVLLVPVEDFAWPVAAAVAVPAVWELLGPSGEDTRGTRTRDH